MLDTKTTILDAAEKLFSDGGFDGTSTRSIVAEAQVNLAAINYHFGSREGLVHAVLQRRLLPLNRERLRLLDECELRAGKNGSLPVREVVYAMIAPAIWFSRDPEKGGGTFMRLLGRVFIDPSESWQATVEDLCGDTIRRFIAAYSRALPKLAAEDLFWRVHFGVGAFVHTLCSSHHIHRVSGGVCDSDNADGMIERLTTFIEAGLLAPVPLKRKKSTR